MASPTSAPLFQQPVSVRWILSETLTGFWLEASDDGDFAGSSVAPPSNELDDSLCLLGLICPVQDCLGDGQFGRWIIVQVLFSVVLFFDLKVVGQLLPLPLHKLYLPGSLRGSISLCIIMGSFLHELSCIQPSCWFAALSLC